MRNLMITAGAVASVLAMAVAPGSADAHRYHHYTRYHNYRGSSECQRRERSAGTTGAVVGGVGGGLAGNAIGHGSLAGTLIGAGVGAYAGHKIGQNSHNC